MRRLPWSVRTDSGWNCTPSMGRVLWRRPMMVPGSGAPVPGRAAEISSSSGMESSRDDERVVAGAGHGLRRPAKTLRPSCSMGLVLPCMSCGARTTSAAEGRADGLMAEADAEDGDLLGSGEVADERDEDAGVLRRAGAGREDDARGVQGLDLVGRDLVVAADDDLARPARRCTGRGCR